MKKIKNDKQIIDKILCKQLKKWAMQTPLNNRSELIYWRRVSSSCSNPFTLAKIRRSVIWRVWRYQRGNQNPYMEEELTVITKLPNSEQSYKGKVKTHNYINRQNQSTTRKLWKQTTQWSKEKLQNDKQRSTKHKLKIM